MTELGCVYTVTLSAENAQKRKLFFADAPFVYTTTMKTSSVLKRSIMKTKTLLKVETFKNDKTETTIEGLRRKTAIKRFPYIARKRSWKFGLSLC